MSDKTRREEILGAVDTLIQSHDEWMEDDGAPDTPTKAMEDRLEVAIEVCAIGGVPGDCRQLVATVGELGVHWREYSEGAWGKQGEPLPQFWGAFRTMLSARSGAMIKKPVSPELVCNLVAQGVTARQIAENIYGWKDARGNRVGPFLDPENGQVLDGLIRQEAETPGSVIPDGWVKDSQLEKYDKRVKEAEARISTVEDIENKEEKKPTVEQMLKDGAYVSQIASVTGVEEDGVRSIAAILGVRTFEMENVTGAVRAPHERQLTESDHRSLQPKNVDPDDDDDDDDGIAETDPVEDIDDEAATLEDLIVEKSEDGETSTDIAKGLGITVQKAAQVLRRHREKASIEG